jgi:hypothetical protein
MSKRPLVDAGTGARVALGIEIDEQHSLPDLRQARGQIDRSGRLADTAFLISNAEDAGHRSSSVSGKREV